MSDPFAGLAPRDKEPNSGTNFLNWLAQAANRQQMAPKRVNIAAAIRQLARQPDTALDLLGIPRRLCT